MLPQLKLISIAGIALIAVLATPALAGSLYKWTTEDGSVAFTDDPKRVPERYRSQAKTIKTGGLDVYERFSPTDTARQTEQQKRLQERLERLRELNRPPRSALVPAPGVQPNLIIKTNERTAVTIPNTAEGDSPVIVEEMRVRDPDSIATRHVTVVRQGDRVLSVVKPANPAQSADPPSEREFE
jgi:hypothetical protein